MNVTDVGRGEHTVPASRRPGLLAAGALAFVGVALLGSSLVGSARLEVLLAALGCIAGAALVALLTD